MGCSRKKKTTLFLWSSKDLEFEFSMSPYSHWGASSSGCKNNSLRKISGLVSKWIMDDSRLENSRYPSEWVSEWPGAACRVRQAMRWRLIVSDVVIRDIRNVLTFAIPNPMRLLLWRLRFFLLDRKLPLYSTLLKAISIPFLIVWF